MLGFRGVLAVGLAALVLGGLGGTAVGFALDGEHHPAPMDGRFPGGPGAPGGPDLREGAPGR